MNWSEPEDVAFRAEVDETVQRYVLLRPSDWRADQAYPLLVALHGHGADRWQYIKEERGECRGARDVALRHGMILVSPDYRAPDSWMGPAAEADVVQIIGHLRKSHKIRKIILAGGSMGGAGVLTFTALHPDLVHGVVSENGMANLVEYEGFQDSRTKWYGGDKQQRPEEYRKRSAEFFPDRFTMPIAFTAGGNDTSVPPQSVLRLAEAVGKTNANTLLLYREDGGHATDYEDTVRAMEFVVGKVLGTGR